MVVGLKKEQVYQKLREDIENGRFAEGSKLPREIELSEKLGISRVTLRPALKRLENEGYIQRLHGRGTFVMPASSRNNEKQTILVISEQKNEIHQPQNYIVPAVFKYASEHNLHAESFGYRYLSMSTPEDFAEIATKLNTIGIILVGNNFNGSEPIINILKAANCPVILPHAKEQDYGKTGFTVLFNSSRKSWKDSLIYLKKLGYRRVGQLGDSGLTPKPTPFRNYSLDDVLEVSGKLGLETDLSLFKTASIYDENTISVAVSEWLALEEPPEAILCFSDFFAFHVYDTIKKHGLSIPGDIGVMGICGSPDAALINPPLTSIDYCYSDLAEQSVSMIAEGKLPPEGIKIEHKCVLRERASLKKMKNQKNKPNYKNKSLKMEVPV